MVTSGESGILLEPPFYGHVAVEDDEAVDALKPVVIGPAPGRVVG